MKKILHSLFSIGVFILIIVMVKKCIKHLCSDHSCCDIQGRIQNKIKSCVFDKIAKKLDFTFRQKNEILDIFKEMHKKKEEFKTEFGPCSAMIIEQLRKETIETEALKEEIDKKQNQCNESMKPFIVEKFAQLHGIMNAHQREKLADMIEWVQTKCAKLHSCS